MPSPWPQSDQVSTEVSQSNFSSIKQAGSSSLANVCALQGAALGLGHTRVLGLHGSASHCLGVEKVFPCVALRTGTFSSSLGRCGWVLLCLSAAAAPLSWSACINFHHMSNPIKLSALLERG